MFNEYDIDRYANMFQGHPVLQKATTFLQRFRDEVNAHSDGWCHWPLPARAAKKLMEMIRAADPARPWPNKPVEPTEADLKSAMTPIKAFCTRNAKSGITMPSAEVTDPTTGGMVVTRADVEKLVIARLRTLDAATLTSVFNTLFEDVIPGTLTAKGDTFVHSGAPVLV